MNYIVCSTYPDEYFVKQYNFKDQLNLISTKYLLCHFQKKKKWEIILNGPLRTYLVNHKNNFHFIIPLFGGNKIQWTLLETKNVIFNPKPHYRLNSTY